MKYWTFKCILSTCIYVHTKIAANTECSQQIQLKSPRTKTILKEERKKQTSNKIVLKNQQLN